MRKKAIVKYCLMFNYDYQKYLTIYQKTMMISYMKVVPHDDSKKILVRS